MGYGYSKTITKSASPAAPIPVRTPQISRLSPRWPTSSCWPACCATTASRCRVIGMLITTTPQRRTLLTR